MPGLQTVDAGHSGPAPLPAVSPNSDVTHATITVQTRTTRLTSLIMMASGLAEYNLKN